MMGDRMKQIFLKLDCSKIKTKIGWKPIWGIEITMQKNCGVDRVLFA